MNSKVKYQEKNRGSAFIWFALLAAIIAVSTFLFVFFANPRAKETHKYSDLKIPIPTPPNLPTATPKTRIVEPPLASSPSPTISQPSTTSAELEL